MIDANDRGASAFEQNFDRQVKTLRGRPRRKTAVVITTVRLDQSVYDALCRKAIHERVSLSAILQRAVVGALTPARN